MKLHAIITDNNEESSFMTPLDRVDYKEGMTLADIRQAYINRELKSGSDWPADKDWARDEIEQTAVTICEAWVVNSDQLKQIKSLRPSRSVSEREDRVINQACKRLAKSLAIKTLR